jgi:hypothetical protein
MRWVWKETVIEFQSGTVAIEGYFQIERVVSQKEKGNNEDREEIQ